MRTPAPGQLLASVLAGATSACLSTPVDYPRRAQEVAHATIVIDGHVDLPSRLVSQMQDVSQTIADGDFDYPRARAGGLDAPFMSIYVPASMEQEGGGKEFAERLIDIVEQIVADHPDKFALARTAADIRRAFAGGKIALPMGMENGTPIEGDLANLDYFYARGIRYITLCHSEDNHICDSSYDTRHTHGGLTEFGEQVVRRMNELGIMIDVSHISDDSFWDVLELTRAPVIASHSSLRHFVPGFERNMSDEMVRRVAENGGVVQINFGSSFISAAFNEQQDARRAHLAAYFDEHGLDRRDPQAREYARQYSVEHPIAFADVTDVADHIDRVVELAGIDHVGLGSDFDGVGDSLPTGLKDVSQYPNLLAVLLERGYSRRALEKICSGNVLRVMEAVERTAREGQR